jgi:hypothetical protein
MSDDLDALMAGLARAPADHELAGLEGAVLAGLAERRAARRLGPAQAGAVAAAVFIGLAAGGAAGVRTTPPQSAGMLPTDLAPSSLLVASR